MKLKTAKEKIKKITNVKFKKIFSESDLKKINKNKGIIGQLLEQKIGLKLSNTNRDFENGELKTYKSDKNRYQEETICITQISSIIDELIKNKKFKKTKLYEKIKNVLFVPILKEENPKEWVLLKYIHIKLSKSKYKSIYKILKEDYNYICKKLNEMINKDEKIHSISGQYLEIRTKDTKNKSGNYHPISSNKYNKIVSDKNYAFYFTKNFIKDIINNY